MTVNTQNQKLLRQYTAASEGAAAQIIQSYSTSFGIATRLLGARHRSHIKNVYALVRIADELVDGVSAEAQLTPDEQLVALNELENETHFAMDRGYSSNPIVHAFAITARLSGIDRTMTTPFFESMRMDLRAPDPSKNSSPMPDQKTVVGFDEDRHAEYVHGSAEVVGLMCLRIFIRDENYSDEELRILDQGAISLGAAFQNINFIRDLADDTERLQRSYLSDGRLIDEQLKTEWIATIRNQLAEAEAALPYLPKDAKVGVDCAYRLFARLTDKLESTNVALLLKQRIRISNFTKTLLFAKSISKYYFGASQRKAHLS